MQDYSLSSFNEEFSPDEVGRIVGMIEKYKQLSVDENVCRDYIEVIRSFRENESSRISVNDNDSFLKDLERHRKKNGD